MTRAGVLSSSRKMTMAEHIREVQARFFGVAVVFIAGASLAYVFRDQIVHALLSPLGQQTLIYLNPAGGFSFILLVSLYCGLFFATPLLIHQIYSFIRPMLPKNVQRYSGRILFLSLLLLICGALFGYFMAVPGALNFLSTFAEEYVVASLTADSYLNFIVAYTIGLGVVFQLPLLLIIFHWIKPLTPGGLLRSERWIIILAFVAAAIITPTPDPVNQAIVAAPIVVLYQFGVMAVLINIRRANKVAKKSARNKPIHHPKLSKLAIALTLAPTTVEASNNKSPLSTTKSRVVRSVDGFRPRERSNYRPANPTARLAQAEEYALNRQLSRPPAKTGYLDGISRVLSA